MSVFNIIEENITFYSKLLLSHDNLLSLSLIHISFTSLNVVTAAHVVHSAFSSPFVRKMLYCFNAVSYTHLDVYKRQIQYLQQGDCELRLNFCQWVQKSWNIVTCMRLSRLVSMLWKLLACRVVRLRSNVVLCKHFGLAFNGHLQKDGQKLKMAVEEMAETCAQNNIGPHDLTTQQAKVFIALLNVFIHWWIYFLEKQKFEKQ